MIPDSAFPSSALRLPSRVTACLYVSLSCVCVCVCDCHTHKHIHSILCMLTLPHWHRATVSHTHSHSARAGPPTQPPTVPYTHIISNVMNSSTRAICSTGWLTLYDTDSSLPCETRCVYTRSDNVIITSARRDRQFLVKCLKLQKINALKVGVFFLFFFFYL